MLKQRYRFHSRGGVKYTYRQGKTVRSPYLTLVCAKNSRHRQRFAVVVSKKIEKTAVGRNRIRRRIYEALRAELKDYPYHMDCIFVVVNKDTAIVPFDELRTTIQKLLKKSLKNFPDVEKRPTPPSSQSS